MSRIGKIDRAIMEHLIDAEAKGAIGYCVAGQVLMIIHAVSRALDMGYQSLPMPLQYIHANQQSEWESQQRKNHAVAQSIRRSLRKLERDGIVTTYQARFTGEPEPDRNNSWCLTETFAGQVF